jgi:hypothetical protein
MERYCVYAKAGAMAVGRVSKRFTESIVLVKRIVDRVCVNNSAVSKYGLKDDFPSYEVWVTHKQKTMTVQSFTGDIILHCTDPDEATARKFQAFIEICIRRGMHALLPPQKHA